MKLQSKVTYTSEVYPEVSFTVRVLNHIQRARRDLGIAEHLEAYAKHDARRASMVAEAVGAEADPAKRSELIAKSPRAGEIFKAVADREMIYEAHIQPAEIRAGLVEVKGLEIDGSATPTVDQVIASAPDDLLKEIAKRCNESAGLTAEQQKN